MAEELPGLHHVTAITADAQKNIDFYAGVLGLRVAAQRFRLNLANRLDHLRRRLKRILIGVELNNELTRAGLLARHIAFHLAHRRTDEFRSHAIIICGAVANATYRNHGNHAEAIEISFDPQVISFRQLLEFFFQIHDPSTPNRQGNDRGASYRSAIFYTSDEQKRFAEDTIADVNASGLWPGKVVTEVAAAGPFWEAEPEHQDYLERYPDGYTCHFIRPNWKLPRRQEAAQAMAGGAR